MRHLAAAALMAATLLAPATVAARGLPASIYDTNVTGSFFGNVVIDHANTSRFVSATFTIAPKPGATAKALSATFSAAYLASIGNINAGAQRITVPIYGLYADYTNSVTISYKERSGSARFTTVLGTPGYPYVFNPADRVDVVARNPSVKLDFGYLLVKNLTGNGPTILDTDGDVRWAVPGDYAQGSYLWGSYLYFAIGTSLYRMGLDGTSTFLADYAGIGVTGFHHNFDLGKRGLLIEVNTTNHVESTILEVDKDGAVLETFDISAIVRAAMTSDDLATVNSTWIRDGVDWFHNNAATYWKKYDTLVVSGREDFVIGIGFTDKQVKWILGDTNKGWYQSFDSLDRFAISLAPGGLPPIGEHAVSIYKDQLLLFDNGEGSYNQCCISGGLDRDYSAPRMYSINPKKLTAVQTWSYEHGQEVNSTICSSVYADGNSKIIDYAHAGGGSRYIGLGKNDAIAFEWVFPGYACWHGWNTNPIHPENLSY